LNSQSKPIVVHVDHLKPCQGKQPPDNWLEEQDSLQVEKETPNETLDMQVSNGSLVQPVQNYPVKTRTGRTVKPRDFFSP
jgi:hypothetical protein